MEYKPDVSQHPIGKGKKLNDTRETLPAVEVKNEVVWVNPDLDLPFDLKVGEPTKLGVFLSDEAEEENSRNLEVESFHNRSAVLGRVVFGEKTANKDGTKQLFRDVDIKGMGYLNYFQDKEDSKIHQFVIEDIARKPERQGHAQSWGISTLDRAERDVRISKEFRELGIRTYRIAAIISLKEVVYQGEIISVEKAKEIGIIATDAEPVLEVRAFGTHARLIDAFTDLKTDQKRKDFLEDARLLVAAELGKDPKSFTQFEYLKWLGGTIGKNLALMHKNGYLHGFLAQGHNITLDGAFVDFESTKKLEEGQDNAFKLEDSAAFQALKRLLAVTEFRYPINKDEYDEILREYEVSYDKHRNS